MMEAKSTKAAEASSLTRAGPSSPSPSAAASKDRSTPPPKAAEVSPGEGAFSPPKEDIKRDLRRGGEGDNDGDDGGSDEAMGFGPPPAFPSTSKALGKRKRTLMAVSTSATGGAPLEGLSSEDEDDDDEEGASKKHQSQVIHRIKAGDDAKSPEQRGEAGKYEDAMLLASLSDVDSPKMKPKQEEEGAAVVDAETVKNAVAQLEEEARQEEQKQGGDARSPPRGSSSSSGGTSSTAATPLRSNVNANTNTPVAESSKVVKPFALQPKRGKYNENNTLTVIASVPQSPDGRDPKAVKVKKEGAREGASAYAPSPQQPHLSSRGHPAGPPPSGAYPYHPGYNPYPAPHQGGPPPSPYGSAPGHPAYPPGYPYHMSPYAPPPMSHPSTYHPRPYYPGQHPSSQVPPSSHGGPPPTSYGGPPPSSHTSQGGGGGPAQERWGHYHSPKQERMPPAGGGAGGPPEPVRSNPEQQQRSPYRLHPSSGGRSHLVPSEDGDAGVADGGAYGRVPPASYGGPHPPGLGYRGTDSRYGAGPPPTTRDGYYPAAPGGPPPVEYAAISRDECSPPRSSQSLLPHPEYPPAVNTPPRGHYDYYHDQQQGGGVPPGYAPPSSGGYHPDSPLGSSPYPYGRAPPPPGPPSANHDPYEPFDYSAPSPNEAHYHVPAAVSNETEPASHHNAPPTHSSGPPPSSGVTGGMKYHQFRKGGRTIHSEPIVLRKKFSWRNYPELEEYLIANRTDYLRHSALNYTAEQKHFNNRLTEGLLELAAKLNYVFDETCFNFVAVRDRIRCYYKSYVQSSKKRGVVVGFSRHGAKKEHEHEHAEHNEHKDHVMGQV